MMARRAPRGRAAVVLGAGLILVDVLFFVFQTVRIDIAFTTWPLWVIVPGVFIFGVVSLSAARQGRRWPRSVPC